MSCCEEDLDGFVRRVESLKMEMNSYLGRVNRGISGADWQRLPVLLRQARSGYEILRKVGGELLDEHGSPLETGLEELEALGRATLGGARFTPMEFNINSS